jgi:hypothetical protein
VQTGAFVFLGIQTPSANWGFCICLKLKN